MAIPRFLFLVPFKGIGDLGEQTDQQTLNQPLLADDNFVDLSHHGLNGVENLVRVYFCKSRHGFISLPTVTLSKMECWNIGVFECLVLNASLHYSTTPVLQTILRALPEKSRLPPAKAGDKNP